MFKSLGNIASLMKQANQIGGKMKELNEKLKSTRVSGNAGGGLVVVEMNGLAEMLKISIDPDLLARNERELIEELIPAAVNQAQTKAKQVHAEEMQAITGGLNLPGLEDTLAQMSGGATGPE